MDVAKVREDFPFLQQKVNGKPIVYFDNACMSVRPRVVIDEITRYYTELSACAGRSNHRFARAVNDSVHAARKTVQKFLNAKQESEIVFTRNTTEGLNLVAFSLGLKSGDVVVTGDKEHNSNLVPWLKLKKSVGIEHVVVRSKVDNTFDMEAFEKILKEKKPKLVSVVMSSNLDGVTNPIKEIAAKAHAMGALVMVDAAQAVPHQTVDVQDLDVDFLAFSGHKMLGPSGMGVLYGKKELLEKMEGFLVGGDTVEYTTYTEYKHLPVPEKYEAGLQDYAGIMGLGKAAEHLMDIGLDAVHEHEQKLTTLITKSLDEIDRVEIIGPHDPALRGGITSFTVEGIDPHQIALMLDETAGIMVRSGQHCVHSWFNAHELSGSVRASVYFYNTQEEAERFAIALKEIINVIG